MKNFKKATREELAAFAQSATSDIRKTAFIEPVEGGNLNYVWRITDDTGSSWIIKQAPPFVAAQPDIPLDDSRIMFESRILKAFMQEKKLASLNKEGIAVPRFLGFDRQRSLLLMKDMGKLPGFYDGFPVESSRAQAEAGKLGKFIAELHLRTFNIERFKAKFNNKSVQQTRFEVQYSNCKAFCKRAGIRDDLAEEAGKACAALGKKLLSEGYCQIMGDLWPESILVDSKGLALIDWEMTHFGRPFQDVAHLDAHLWMMIHRSKSEEAANALAVFRKNFLETYFLQIRRNIDFAHKLSKIDYNIHFGAEILARTVGAFQEGYIYEGLPPDDPAIQEACDKAIDCIVRHTQEIPL